jgi:hypothetical protein
VSFISPVFSISFDNQTLAGSPSLDGVTPIVTHNEATYLTIIWEQDRVRISSDYAQYYGYTIVFVDDPSKLGEETSVPHDPSKEKLQVQFQVPSATGQYVIQVRCFREWEGEKDYGNGTSSNFVIVRMTTPVPGTVNSTWKPPLTTATSADAPNNGESLISTIHEHIISWQWRTCIPNNFPHT